MIDDVSIPIDLEAKNGDMSLISETMAEEEEKLLEDRMKEDVEEANVKKEISEDLRDPSVRFSKLDELLTQTQLYSQFLLEKMEDITMVLMLVYISSKVSGFGLITKILVKII